MELIVQKYALLEKPLKLLEKNSSDFLADIVFATEIGFIESINNRDFIHSHTFCFHYCIDKYQNKSHVSFSILNSNNQTGQYCFWDYTSNFYNPKTKGKSFDIDNSHVKAPITEINFDYKNKHFTDIIQLVKQDLLETHENTLKLFKQKDIHYDSSMNTFSNELKQWIDITYQDILKLELSDKIKLYEAQLLNTELPNKQTTNSKKIKI